MTRPLAGLFHIVYSMLVNANEGCETAMSKIFGETLRRLRAEKGFTQQQLADHLYMDRTSVASWETGRRMPDVATVALLSKALGVDVATLVDTEEKSRDALNVLLVDDMPIILEGGIQTLRKAIPNANVIGFSDPADVLNYVKENRVALIFLDIELGTLNGIDLCRELLRIRPLTNVIYLTSYPEYSLKAWETGASGFIVKPLKVEKVRQELCRLRHPVKELL